MFYFGLRLPQKLVITIRNLRIGDVNLRSRDLAWKFYFHSLVEACFQGFFLEIRILRKLHILKRFNFLVSEYGNLTSIKTHRDRLKSLENTFKNRRFRFSGSGRDWRPHGGFRCFLVVDLSFFCWLCLRVFKNFLVSALDCPFSGFHSRVTFFFFIHFLSFFLFNYPIMHSKIQNLFWTGEWFIKRILIEEQRQ